MKIVCINRSVRLGGAERQFVGLATFLSQRGHDVTVVTYRKGDFFSGELSGSGARHVQLHLPLNRKGMKTLAMFLHEQQPDVVVTFMSGSGIRAAYVKKHFNLPYKLTVSDRNLTARFNPLDFIKYYYFKIADLWLPNSHAQAAYLLRRFPDQASKIKAIPNFCDTSVFNMPDDRSEHEPVRIVTTARLCKRKNAHNWIKAVALVARKRKDFVVDWVGTESMGSYYKKCQRLISKYGLEDRFHILPTSKDVRGVYANSDIFCLPSLYEGTPNSLCEALACGLPAICSDVSDNALYVQQGRSGFLFDPYSVQSMAAALEKILDCTSQQRCDMGRHASENVNTLMGIQRFTDCYEDTLKNIVGLK